MQLATGRKCFNNSCEAAGEAGYFVCEHMGEIVSRPDYPLPQMDMPLL